MTPLEVLTAARTLIAKSEHWCQRTYTCDAAGKPVDVESGKGKRFCLSMAMMLASDWENDSLVQAESYIAQRIEHGGIIRFNDTHTHAEVIGLLDTAIAELSG